MALQDKYKQLIDAAKSDNVADLEINEKDGVLNITGIAHTGKIKDELWVIYDKIDPDFKAGDLILDINVTPAVPGSKIKVSTESTDLNIRKGPGTDQPVVGRAVRNDIISLISQSNEQWWLVRTDKGDEGYAYAKYLTIL